MGGGAAACGAEAAHLGGVDLRGDRGRQVVGQQDGVGRPGGGAVRIVTPAQQVAQHTFTHVLQVGGAGGQRGVGQRALRGHPHTHRMPPGPGHAVALHHAAAGGQQQVGVLQQARMGGEDARLLGLARRTGGVGQLLQLCQRGRQGFVQGGGFGGDGGEAVIHLQRGGLGLHQRANHQPRAGGNTGEGLARGGLPVAQLAAQALGLRLAGCGQLGLAVFFLPQAHDGVAQRDQCRLGVCALGRQAQLCTPACAQAQQRGQAFGVGHGVAAAHMHPRRKTFGHMGPLACGPGMQAIRVVEREFVAEGKVFQRSGLGGGGGLFPRERTHDLLRVLRGGQALHQGVVTHQAGQAAQNGDVLVGRSRNRHHQPRLFAVVAPAHAARHLQHGQPGAQHQVFVLHHAVGNGQPLAEEGVGHFLALQQAVGVGRLRVARLGQQRTGGAHRVFTVMGCRTEADFDRYGHAACLQIWYRFQKTNYRPPLMLLATLHPAEAL